MHDVARSETEPAENNPSVERWISAEPARVWAVLSDGWLYPSWVVGASRMREVDDGWPASGTRLHHSVGNWPLLINDRTEVLEMVPEKLLRLQAHGWPAGAAEVLIELESAGTGTTVRIREDAVAGPAKLMPKPLRQLAMLPRNREALRRLAFLAEGGAAS
ncbi:MAG TPA: SRPBCC family protein [Nocardioidaceae bacterium]|nr:SRPBCC family protein [Nocardioidaceae bacterium]